MFSCRTSKKLLHPNIEKTPIDSGRTVVPQAHSADSGRRAWSGTSCRASLTVEAALSLPIVIFAIVLLMMPFKILRATEQMQKVAEEISADVSRFAFTKKQIAEGFPIADDTGILGSFAEAGTSVILGEYAASKAKTAVADRNLTFVGGLRTSCLLEDDCVSVVLDYHYKLPFVSLFGVDGIDQSVISSRRAWVGRDGAANAADAEAEEEEEWVWIGANPTRYHLNPECHYLSNHFLPATAVSSGKKQSLNGKTYTACERCARNVAAGQTVYVLPAGDHFHTSQDCSALAAYVKKVQKSTVEHLGPCSYCGKN